MDMYPIQIQVSRRPVLQGIPVSVVLKTGCFILVLENNKQSNNTHSFKDLAEVLIIRISSGSGDPEVAYSDIKM